MYCVLYPIYASKNYFSNSISPCLFCYSKILCKNLTYKPVYKRNPPLGKKKKTQKSEPVDGIVALQKTFQKIPHKKHASLSAVFNHLLLNQCSILLLLSAPHAQPNKQNSMM